MMSAKPRLDFNPSALLSAGLHGFLGERVHVRERDRRGRLALRLHRGCHEDHLWPLPPERKRCPQVTYPLRVEAVGIAHEFPPRLGCVAPRSLGQDGGHREAGTALEFLGGVEAEPAQFEQQDQAEAERGADNAAGRDHELGARRRRQSGRRRDFDGLRIGALLGFLRPCFAQPGKKILV